MSYECGLYVLAHSYHHDSRRSHIYYNEKNNNQIKSFGYLQCTVVSQERTFNSKGHLGISFQYLMIPSSSTLIIWRNSLNITAFSSSFSSFLSSFPLLFFFHFFFAKLQRATTTPMTKAIFSFFLIHKEPAKI